jgi:hypothetical protein
MRSCGSDLVLPEMRRVCWKLPVHLVDQPYNQSQSWALESARSHLAGLVTVNQMLPSIMSV